MGFFWHPAFLTVTVAMAIGLVAYEIYQSHRAHSVSTGRRRRRRSSDEYFETYENIRVRNSHASNSSSRAESPRLSEGRNEIRCRQQALEVNPEDRRNQDVRRDENTCDIISRSNEGGRESGVVTSLNPLHQMSRSADNHLQVTNLQAGSSEFTSSEDSVTALVENVEIVCHCCDEHPVTTIVLPCGHKYTCEECAPMLFKQYKKCPNCRSEIVSFKSVRD